MATERLFLGIWLTPLFGAEIRPAFERLYLLYPGQKWVNPGFIHFTLHFLGETTYDKKQKVIQIARQTADITAPFDLALEGMDAFPGKTHARVVWIGAAPESHERLVNLYREITIPLIGEGFPVEHETFTPHATLFRRPAGCQLSWDDKNFQFPKTGFQKVDRFFLFKSKPGPNGSIYEPCEEFPFGSV